MNDKIHKWEMDGLGKAPFKCVGMAQIPSPALAEHNPDAYNNAMRDLPHAFRLGTCAVCGMPIMYNYLITTADGKKFAVGSECVLKRAGADKMMIDRVKAEKNKMLREKREEKRRAAWEAERKRREEKREAELQAQREKNGGPTDEEIEKQIIAEIIRKKSELLAPLADLMADGKGGFRDNIAAGFRMGQLPLGRGGDITLDILAKMAGRRNSKAYNEEYDRILDIFRAVEDIKGRSSNGV